MKRYGKDFSPPQFKAAFPGAGVTKRLFRRLFLPVLWGLALGACDILRDSPFDVEGWSPGEGYHPRPEELSVSVQFSHEPDRVSAERAFSLTEDGLALGGSFRWEDRCLIFSPFVPLELNRDYLVSLSTDARDGEGLSLEKKFEAPFSTRSEKTRPRVVSIEPVYGGLLELRQELKIRFSLPLLINPCVNSISLSPSMDGAWRLEEGERTAVFTPLEPWKPGLRYRVNVSTGFTAANGLPLEREFTSSFVTALDKEPPFLTKAWGLKPDGTPVELVSEKLDGGAAENSFWESDTRLRLDFSEPVDTAGLKNRLTVESAPALIMETEPGFAASVIFRFAENPAYQSRFIIRLNSGVQDVAKNESLHSAVFHVFTGGKNLQPPSLRGIRFPLAPGKAGMEEQIPSAFSPADIFADLSITNDAGHFPYQEPVPFWVELYFDRAPGAAVDAFSVMDIFRVETSNNDVLSFSPRSIQDADFTWTEPQAGWESCYRLEIRGSLKNMENSGVVSFRLDPGLLDSLGNRNEKHFRISLLK